MSIEYYVGTEGVTVNVEDLNDLYQAIDILHTQVMDNVEECQEEALSLLSETMRQIEVIADENSIELEL